MSIEEIRQHHESSPFKPFTLRLCSGRAAVVEHSEFMHVPPEGDTFVVWDRAGGYHLLDAASVEEIDFSPIKKTNGRKRH